MTIIDWLLYAAAFFGLWLGSGLVISSVRLLANRIRMSSFAFSFFVLGVLTSIPEIAVGTTALVEHHPEIFIGNLLGGIVVIFLLVIPLLAVINKRVHVKEHLSNGKMLITLAVIGAPTLVIADKTVTNPEGIMLILLYAALFFVIRTRQGVMARIRNVFKQDGSNFKNSSILKLLIGIAIVFFTSRFIVDQTILVGETYELSTFLVSLVILGLGTNLPEISLALRSLVSKTEDIALGDYLGSAAANTLLFGVFTLINYGDVVAEKSFVSTSLFIALSLVVFFALTRTQNTLTRVEGMLLLAGYAVFVIFEYLQLA
jgi:cation:H+ antiporter